MIIRHILSIGVICYLFLFNIQPSLLAQSNISGTLLDSKTGEALIGATVLVKGSTLGTSTDYDGNFVLKYNGSFPVELECRYSGYASKIISYDKNDRKIQIQLEEESIMIDVVEVSGQRISDKQKASPLTVESMDLIAIKETPSANFYDGLGSLKDVDLTAASLGFKVINTRGFNSTSPVRSLQIIDGVDNQAPGLNFSLGNFLGCSELDVQKVDLIIGASSAFYGPNAFNGVISMETKSPFFHKGLTAQLKTGERNLFEGSIRYANAFKNKNGDDFMGFKLNFFFLKANDWVANNYNPVDGTKQDSIYTTKGIASPGRWDAVNIYGDEYYSLNDLTSDKNNSTLTENSSSYFQYPGIRLFSRTGYKEIDLVDYNTRNYKANFALHFRLSPKNKYNSPELILASCFGSGTTVYQGDNRFSLKNILFFQNRIELRKENKYFLRLYATSEDAGDSYDPYFTALKLLQYSKDDETWSFNYRKWWQSEGGIVNKMREMGYPQLKTIFDSLGIPHFMFDFDAAKKWLVDHSDSLRYWHTLAEANANKKEANPTHPTNNYLVPGTTEFNHVFDSITRGNSNTRENGTKFFDQSALYHAQGEYKFTPDWLDYWLFGANMRFYRPYSQGTIFVDSNDIRIHNFEYGVYSGISKKFLNNNLTCNFTFRVDKNDNFDFITTPAASLVYKPKENTYFRFSYSSALRNPTLTDQYLHLDVGRAILVGNLNGFDSLITVESFVNYLGNHATTLVYFNAAPIKPEQVNTYEFGFRTSLFNRIYLDAGYYFSSYSNFIGYNIGVKSTFDTLIGLPINPQVYRISANSLNNVQTQGFSIGMNYYFNKYYSLSGNYSLNKLTKTDENDPIIPAYNTPQNKFNIGLSGRDMDVKLLGSRIRNLGFNINYKWVDSFVFEGSPQFTGLLPSYDILDVQLNYKKTSWNTTFKLGASNVLNNQHFETYGGPAIGRLLYFSLLYEWKKN